MWPSSTTAIFVTIVLFVADPNGLWSSHNLFCDDEPEVLLWLRYYYTAVTAAVFRIKAPCVSGVFWNKCHVEALLYYHLEAASQVVFPLEQDRRGHNILFLRAFFYQFIFFLLSVNNNAFYSFTLIIYFPILHGSAYHLFTVRRYVGSWSDHASVCIISLPTMRII